MFEQLAPGRRALILNEFLHVPWCIFSYFSCSFINDEKSSPVIRRATILICSTSNGYLPCWIIDIADCWKTLRQKSRILVAIIWSVSKITRSKNEMSKNQVCESGVRNLSVRSWTRLKEKLYLLIVDLLYQE